MKISLIAAMAENHVIGCNNKLPWHLPADLGWFKKNTLNKPIVMGRKTWESLPFRPLPGRVNIIVSRDKLYQPLNQKNEVVSEAIIVTSVDEAIEKANQEGLSELMFIGGAMLYKQVLDKADYLYLTLVKGNFEGDAWFPELDFTQWQENFHQDNEPDDNNHHHYSFIIYQRTQEYITHEQ
ncbi:MAG: type 3 dihydrofolate reductase [gamma proteobacterium symbiont of Taylorina sp.]|nr:type 3 dihydrofolate reductase [gamma proteobacterium symbiont of Taylorina sp.]